MKKIKKFVLKDAELVSKDELKYVLGGIRRNLTLYDCIVEGDKVPNEGRQCIVSYEDNVIHTGICKATYVTSGEEGRFESKLVAYCSVD